MTELWIELLKVIFNSFINNNSYISSVPRYLNIYVGMPDIEESFNVTRPVAPHEVTSLFTCDLMTILIQSKLKSLLKKVKKRTSSRRQCLLMMILLFDH